MPLTLEFTFCLQMFFHSQVMELGIAIGGAVVFSLFIIVDTSMMMHTLSPGENRGLPRC